MKQVAAYSKPEEAYLAASLLEGNGLTVNVRDADTIGNYWMYSQAIGGVKIEVPEEEVDQAMEILNLPKAEEGILRCPHCQSGRVKMREMNLLNALSILSGFLIPIRPKKVDCLDCKQSFHFDPKKAGPR